MVRQGTGRERAAARAARGLCCALVLAASPAAGAMEFGAAPARAEWKLRRSVLECRLSQPIPLFGEAVFRQGAGESPQFLLRTSQRLLAGDASLRVESPPWGEPIAPITLASVPVQPGRTPVQLGETVADRLQGALLAGLVPVFDRMPSNAVEGHSSVRLVPVNFRAAYGDYRDCLGGLLQASFAQVQRTRIGYDGGGYELGDVGRQRLDLLVEHLKLAGKDVHAIFVDGYSDDTGRRVQNLELSKRRAEGVTAYLVSKGIDAALITTRYHGSRFPVSRGRSEAARAENRRVTVRVERN